MESALIIFIISSILLIIGTVLWKNGNHLLSKGKKAEAIVFKNHFDGEVYFPVVRFLTDKQEWITHQLNIGYSPAKKEGTKLQILYDPDDPTNIQMNSTFVLEILPRMLLAAGICGLIFGTLEYLNIVNMIGD